METMRFCQLIFEALGYSFDPDTCSDEQIKEIKYIIDKITISAYENGYSKGYKRGYMESEFVNGDVDKIYKSPDI